MDGFPRNVNQANSLQKLLDKINQPLEAVVSIQIADDYLMKRLLARGREDSNRRRQIILDEDNPFDSQGRYNIVGVDPDDGLYVYNKDGQSSYQWNLGFKYEF